MRQRWVRHMIEALGYPQGLFAIEKQLHELPHLVGVPGLLPTRRIDLLCYATLPSCAIYPLLLIECKATPLTPQALDQVLGYNVHVGARFVALVNADQAYFCGATEGRLQGVSIPTYQELLDWISISPLPS